MKDNLLKAYIGGLAIYGVLRLGIIIGKKRFCHKFCVEATRNLASEEYEELVRLLTVACVRKETSKEI
nr:MAG TPA: hypothetical protein [Caudoviricetes sp.]